ncbi:MAG: 5-formyltetrahydrofolate cyclo-ligase [Oscillospiraceae bacterium]|nr:5-formyltetrahydrofolate cyclo-ligase [Oscillospiraceae bacterium]
MSGLREEKQALRRVLRQRGAELTPDYRLSADAAIRRAVLESEAWRSAETVFVYVSMWAEPDTRLLLADALASGKTLYVPLCRPDKTLEAVRIRSTAELGSGLLGIPEPPEDGERPGEGGIDLALVPCMSVTRDGRRLGHGLGYYDRFLALHPCRTLCLCYEALLCEDVPTDDLDIRMDAVVTEQGITKSIKKH